MSEVLNKVGLRVSPLSRHFVLARFGKDPRLALAVRPVTNEFWQALCEYSFDGKMPEPGQSVEVEFGGGDEQFIMTLTRKGDAA